MFVCNLYFSVTDIQMERAFGNSSRKYWNNLWDLLCYKFFLKGKFAHIRAHTHPQYLHNWGSRLQPCVVREESERGWCVFLPLYQNLKESAFIVILVLEWKKGMGERNSSKGPDMQWRTFLLKASIAALPVIFFFLYDICSICWWEGKAVQFCSLSSFQIFCVQ